MKKLFTLCMSMLLMGTAHAQIVNDEELDESFVFTDLEGNEVANGSTIVVSELNEEGQMVVPLKAKNASGEKVAVSMYEDISNMPNGEWQTCAFGNCMQLEKSGYSPKNIMDAAYNAGIQTEWIPAANGYATWEARLQIHIFNITKKTVFGQTTETAGDEVIGYGPTVTVRFEYKDPSQQGSVGTLIMGPTLSDEIATDGSGFGRYATGKLSVFNLLTADEIKAFDGTDIIKMRVGLVEAAAISRLIIYPVKGNSIQSNTPILDMTVKEGKAGWNEFELDKPVTLNVTGLDGILMGFEYNQTANGWPLSISEGSHPLYVYGNLGQGVGYYSAGGGDISVQCYMQGEFAPKDIVVNGVQTDGSWFKAGQQLDFGVNVLNFGTAEIGSCTFDVEVDDAVVGTVSSEDALASMATAWVEGQVKLADDLKLGSHKLGLRLKTVDGEAPAGNVDNDYASVGFSVYEQSVDRQKNLLEQFTSQYCTYCPRGVTFFSDLTSQRDDIAWVSIHGNMSSGTDIYTIAAGDSINYFEGVTGYPTASYNRSFVPDLAESSDEIAYGLGYNMSYRTQVVAMLSEVLDYTASAPSFVTLNVNQEYDAETRQLNITVEGVGAAQAAQLLADYGVNVMLTENSLVARQLNEGTWVQKFEHHYVLRAVLGKCTGNSIQWNGDNFTAKFSYTIPEDYNKDNMYVVAFVAPMVNFSSPDTRNMAVNNCEMVAVKDAAASAIQSITTNSNVTERYSLDGRQLPAAQKGLNIVRMADGQVRKVVVK